MLLQCDLIRESYSSPFFWHLLENSIFGHFWPFFTICACSWVTAWSHLRFYWHNYYYWVLLQWYLRRESYSRLLPLHFPTICLKIEFLVILIIFLPFLHPSHCMCVLLYVHLFIHLFIHPSCLQLSKTAKNCQYGAGRHCGWVIHEGMHLFALSGLFLHI